MNIFVCVSHVPDTTTKVQIGADGKHVESNGVTYILNPYDEFALEAGLQLKESQGGEVIAVCVGPEAVKETLRKALAMGVDKGLHLVTDGTQDTFATARAIADALANRGADAVFCGRQSIDYDSGQMAGLLGELMGLPSLSVVSTLTIAADGGITAEREIEGGKETMSSKLPAVISTQKGLNSPRYPKLQGIMAAKKKPIEEVVVDAFAARVETVSMTKPPVKQAGKIVGTGPEAVPELVRLMHDEAKVI